jgi:hypothetical protein
MILINTVIKRDSDQGHLCSHQHIAFYENIDCSLAALGAKSISLEHRPLQTASSTRALLSCLL